MIHLKRLFNGLLALALVALFLAVGVALLFGGLVGMIILFVHLSEQVPIHDTFDQAKVGVFLFDVLVGSYLIGYDILKDEEKELTETQTSDTVQL